MYCTLLVRVCSSSLYPLSLHPDVLHNVDGCITTVARSMDGSVGRRRWELKFLIMNCINIIT